MKEYYIYDIETLPNVFTMQLKKAGEDKWWSFEISERRNDHFKLRQLMKYIDDTGGAMVGYNNLHFDYPIIHMIFHATYITAQQIHEKSRAIFEERNPWAHSIWDSDMLVPQLDLMAMNNYGITGKRISLKTLEFNMRMDKIEEFDLDFMADVLIGDIDKLLEYNKHDVRATELLFDKCKNAIEFREKLTEETGINHMNKHDVQIGVIYFLRKLKEKGIVPKKGIDRPEILPLDLSTCVLPIYEFKTPEFSSILNMFKSTTITNTKQKLKNSTVRVDGLDYSFGLGGLHASVKNQSFESTDEMIIEDWDVESYYPSVSIANKASPSHIGQAYCLVNSELKTERGIHEKGTDENKIIKLALNGVFGTTNLKYSPLYDPKFAMTTTINGQLSLVMLVEQLISMGVKMIQANTDGVSIYYPRDSKPLIHTIMNGWQYVTKLKLKRLEYSKMVMRDVNNYIALDVDGTVKAKGVYSTDLELHQNFNATVVAVVAQRVLLTGENIRTALNDQFFKDRYSFMLATKVDKKSRLELDGKLIQNVSRYYVSTTTTVGKLVKISPAHKNQVAKGNYKERTFKIHKDWSVVVCNDLEKDAKEMFYDINLDFYVNEVEKLVMLIR
jgi:hypothetical protein